MAGDLIVELISGGAEATASFIICATVTCLVRMAAVWFDIRSI